MKQFGKFVLVGVVNTLLGYAVIFTCMYALSLNVYVSNMAGYGFGLIISYLLNRNFTFRSSGSKGREALSFLVVFAIAYGVNLGALRLLVGTGLNAGVCQVLAGAFYITISYFANKYFVFNPGNTLAENP